MKSTNINTLLNTKFAFDCAASDAIIKGLDDSKVITLKNKELANALPKVAGSGGLLRGFPPKKILAKRMHEEDVLRKL